ncbi:MAG: hypothetical protein RML46_11560 [Anaerolineae bacterium]|nr:nucleotidyltransferase family protein [Anaerolineae bacterium]MDW8069539.1 hypothetical protein [Anaerolineae bacterium]
MNRLIEAALELHEFLTRHAIPYAVIGGVAVQAWGEPRLTLDLDLTVMTPPEGAAALVHRLLERFVPRVPDPVAFARRTRVVLIRASNGCDVDISLGVPGYEEDLIRRAVDYEVAPGQTIRLCSPEDLIIHKAVAGRPQDLVDITGIVYRQGERLDVAYIRRWLKEFAAALEMPEIPERFERAWREFQTIESVRSPNQSCTTP